MHSNFVLIKEFLDRQVMLFNRIDFIIHDPISIPHSFTNKEDIEISGFFAAMLSWGQRATIINKSKELMKRMDNSPFEFVSNANEQELQRMDGFVHRTFQEDDCLYFIYALQQIYKSNGGLEQVFTKGYLPNKSIKEAIEYFNQIFFSYPHLKRTRKHVSNPANGSAAKRLNMYLRWMVRKDNKGVDFGLWENINLSDLMCPLDIHTANVARHLGLLSRKANDWQSVVELTDVLRTFDPQDPIKYDFALFGSGVTKTTIPEF